MRGIPWEIQWISLAMWQPPDPSVQQDSQSLYATFIYLSVFTSLHFHQGFQLPISLRLSICLHVFPSDPSLLNMSLFSHSSLFLSVFFSISFRRCCRHPSLNLCFSLYFISPSLPLSLPLSITHRVISIQTFTLFPFS